MGQRRHLGIADASGVQHDRERIALQRDRAEDIDLLEGKPSHAASIPDR
jgi:hypothetical protein